jgi:hypothetical protein
LASGDFVSFSEKVGRNFTTGNDIDFSSDIWYITAAADLPPISDDDVGKVLFVKNIGGADYILSTDGSNTIDGNVNTQITLRHSPQSSVMLQAFSTTQWQVIAHYGTTTLGT